MQEPSESRNGRKQRSGAIRADAAGRTAPRVSVLGVPLEYLPHGKADAILADMGLDATGIAATVKSELL